MTPSERQAFSNYFWTAQLMAGLVMAFKAAVDVGVLWAPVAFVVVMPFAAAMVYMKILADRWFPPKPGPQKARWVGAIVFGLALCALVFGGALLLKGHV